MDPASVPLHAGDEYFQKKVVFSSYFYFISKASLILNSDFRSSYYLI